VLNNPVRFTDPSGHDTCDEDGNCYNQNKGWSLKAGALKWNYSRIIRSGYSDWEAQMLSKLYEKGGRDAKHGVDYIMNHEIHIKVGEPVRCTAGRGRTGTACNGDWQSEFNIGAWYEGNDLIVLNPNDGYSTNSVPDPWGLSLVIHEAKHIEQGFFVAFSKTGEMEAWKIGLEVFSSLTGINPENFSLRSRDVYNSLTVDAFEKAIRTHDTGYWQGLKWLPDRPLGGLVSYPYP